MTRLHRARVSLLLAALPWFTAVACGGSDESKPAPAKAPELAKAPEPTATTAEPVSPTVNNAAAAENPFTEEVWTEDSGGSKDSEGDNDEAEGAAPTVAPDGPLPGPCRVTWSSGGPVVKLSYTDDGGRVRVDHDADGTYDACQMFTRKDGRTTRVSIDDGCDRTTDFRVSPEYEEGSNLAAAKLTAPGGTTEDITLLWLPGVVGFEPAVTLRGARSTITAQIKDGLVHRAQAPARGDHPALRVDLTYDKDRRIKTLREDIEADGVVDRKFTYKFDTRGNLERIDVVVTTPAQTGHAATTSKQRAKFDYGCWK